MKAISTRYVGPTNQLPARVVASDMDGNRAAVSADGDFPYDDAHRAAAVALCAKMNWPGADTLIGGSVKGGRVWVFTEAQS
jgi:hypothetical protein